MTPRQCEIAAEAFTASILARCGFDVLVQYGANQPDYDLVAIRGDKKIPVSVKGSQDGGWMLAVKYVRNGVSYHQAIDKWLSVQRKDIIYIFVQFLNVSISHAPRLYVAQPDEIAAHMKTQCNGRGHGSLQEDWPRDHPKSQYTHRIPVHWSFTGERIGKLCDAYPLGL